MMSSTEFRYVGEELTVFALAQRWKAYWSSRLRPWIQGDVLEVGAGLGTNTPIMHNPAVRSWHCLEPDADLVATLRDAVSSVPSCTVTTGTVHSLANQGYDAILYIDVLEHIREDRMELAAAAQRLRPGGHLIVLSPAHQFLFSQFDAAIGHYRRYTVKTLGACAPPDCEVEQLFYLDSVGMLASLANRLLLRQEYPTAAQILAWDRYIIPASRILDPLARHRLGKTVIGVWRRRHPPL
jgi:SAM-dependent methyltransferase